MGINYSVLCPLNMLNFPYSLKKKNPLYLAKVESHLSFLKPNIWTKTGNSHFASTLCAQWHLNPSSGRQWDHFTRAREEGSWCWVIQQTLLTLPYHLILTPGLHSLISGRYIAFSFSEKWTYLSTFSLSVGIKGSHW